MCALLDIHFEQKMQIYPTYEILNYIINFGHAITWFVLSPEIGKNDNIQSSTYHDVPVFIMPYGNNAATKISHLYKKIKFILDKFNEEKYNMIFVRNGIFDGLLALYIKRKYNVPFIFEIDSPIEQTCERLLFYSKHKHFSYVIAQIEKFLMMKILYKADLILPISSKLMTDLSIKGIDKSKMIIFPDGVDGNRLQFNRKNSDDVRRKYKLENSNIVIYVGTMDRMRQLHVLIDAFSKVILVNKRAKLLMVGDGNDRNNLEKLADELRIKDYVVFTGQIPFEDVPNFIGVADIGICPVPPLDFYKLSSPIKLVEYMAMKKVVIANEEIPEHKSVIKESCGGILVRFDAESFSNSIIKLLDAPEILEEFGERGYEWVVKNRSYDMIAKRFEKGLEKIMRKNEENIPVSNKVISLSKEKLEENEFIMNITRNNYDKK